MEAMDLPRAALIGNSFGCQILAEFAVRHAWRVDRLVLQGPTTDPAARSFREQLRRIWRNSRLEKGAMAAITRRDYAKAGWLQAWRTMRMVLNDRIEDKLPRIAAPVLVLVGSEDPLVPVAWARRVAELLPDGQLVVVPGASHTMNFVSPGEFSRAIQPFLLRPSVELRRASWRVVGS
jgi:pimeloyl-ACP methyl ester carboxylesterase